MRKGGPQLNLWKQHLGEVPPFVWEHTEVESLVLAENSLQTISPQIGLLRSLRMLDLGHNALAEVPAELGELVDLQDFLYLHDNQLASLPMSLAGLKRLRYLNLSENHFMEVPEALAGMTALRELRLANNQIASLPEFLMELKDLRELHLRNNRLESLPASLPALAELRVLDLRGNPLRALPRAMAHMPKLEKLDLRWVETLEEISWLEQLEERGCLVYR